jgi:hypothetical protein
MKAPSSHLARIALVAGLLAAPSAALGYGVWIHYILPTETLKDFTAAIPVPRVKTTILPGATDADLARFREWFYARAAAVSDTGVRHAFLRRYPTAASFDANAFKLFLMMNPEARVMGVDSFEAVYRARTREDAAMDPTAPYTPGQRVSLEATLQMGSVYPDLDRRNQDRLYRESTGHVVLTAHGDTVPIDPMALNWGHLTGLSSQAWAHMGLNHQKHSSDPAVLTLEPWNFVSDFGFPTDSVESFAQPNAQMYTDLSYLAMLGGGRGSEMISYLFAGNAMHYIADVGNQIHTLQAGVKDIYTDATIQYWLSRVTHVFGLFGRTPPRNSIGIDILTNLHTLSENLFETELQNAMRLDSAGKKDSIPSSMQGALVGLRSGDDQFRRVLEAVVVSNQKKYWYPPYGSLIAGSVIDAGYEEGAKIYRLTRTFAVSRLRKAGVRVDFDTVPASGLWAFVRDRSEPQVQAALDTFNILQGRGLGRVNVAIKGWWTMYLTTKQTTAANRGRLIDGLMTRLLVTRLNYLAAADARREVYISLHGGLTQQSR